jgi:ankyrin repeat protein
MMAAAAGSAPGVKALLDAGADPNARDHRNHWTPLLHAVHTRRVDAVRLLLERGADAAARDGQGRSAADFARERGHTSVLEILEEKP